jgi:Pyruvate/2-oxoacid:ferredoxin oxidoreductase delta subunit
MSKRSPTAGHALDLGCCKGSGICLEACPRAAIEMIEATI